ncbi:MAG: DUF3131 domain-containing protein [Acidobacteriota bacterium]
MWRRHRVPGTLALLALFTPLGGCGLAVNSVREGVENFRNSQLFHQGQHGELTDQELEWARTAWRYFENNYNSETGLTNMMDRYGVTSMWCVGDSLAALVAAEQLELIDKRRFDLRMSTLLGTLNRMDLFAGRVPNRLYDTASAKMVGYDNQPAEIGWSAIDLGRLLIWLSAVAGHYPEYGEYAQKAMLRWSFCDVIGACGGLYSGAAVADRIDLVQEGRLGYEEYAALGFASWGFNTARASSWEPYEQITLYGIDLPRDARDPRQTGTFAPVVSLPHLLAGLEFNWDRIRDTESSDARHSDAAWAQLAQKIYAVQEARWRNDRILTARTDNPLSAPPFFVYDAIHVAGYPWNTISDQGDVRNDLALVSSRAAFGLWALFKGDYSETLLKAVCTLNDPDRGWFEGRYEATGDHEKAISCTTNALVLEVLLYKSRGKLFKAPEQPTLLDLRASNVFVPPGRCLPAERRSCT